MKIFDCVQKRFLVINQKEQLLEGMAIISDIEEQDIKSKLTSGDYEFYTNGFELVISEKRPSDFHSWNKKENCWYLDEEKKNQLLKEFREQKWLEIQTFRDKHQGTGAFVESLGKWFHSDQNAIINYLAESLFVNVEGYTELWKTMSDDYVQIDKTKFWEIVSAVYKKCKADFYNAETHRRELMNSEDPMNYDYSSGWSDSYSKAD